MNLEAIKSEIEGKLGKMPAYAFVGKFRFPDEAARNADLHTDPHHFPFYYHLGGCVTPRRLLAIGFGLGLGAACFLTSCRSVEDLVVFHDSGGKYYSPRLGRSNVRDVYKGKFSCYVGAFSVDGLHRALGEDSFGVALINQDAPYDQVRAYLDAAWERLERGGLLAVDLLSVEKTTGRAFKDFCRSVNRDGVQVKTRYGVGLVQR